MIKGTYADILVSIYLLLTLYLRFTIQDSLVDHPILSVALGIMMLLIIWIPIKFKYLQPDYFGLLKKKSSPTESIIEKDDKTLFI